ncbi:hypothetical protein QWJ34_06820 [Saccharibacillus sp. CPCC 101409]|uniref:hypothetical protein n=1 Tax=Saccharibacillus sp. CPCC 101409 TaxID=3058041 RepID=UPI0026722810|nr:hypothetical protein [Saccharibacillus sp. CPCC 101409]MDO3409470.1 hypothetical protein [Saccharibacillus sp. CPCC 101409]
MKKFYSKLLVVLNVLVLTTAFYGKVPISSAEETSQSISAKEVIYHLSGVPGIGGW